MIHAFQEYDVWVMLNDEEKLSLSSTQSIHPAPSELIPDSKSPDLCHENVNENHLLTQSTNNSLPNSSDAEQACPSNNGHLNGDELTCSSQLLSDNSNESSISQADNDVNLDKNLMTNGANSEAMQDITLTDVDNTDPDKSDAAELESSTTNQEVTDSPLGLLEKDSSSSEEVANPEIPTSQIKEELKQQSSSVSEQELASSNKCVENNTKNSFDEKSVNEDGVDENYVSDNEEKAVEEIENAANNNPSSVAKTLGDKLLQFSKSVSPPTVILDVRSTQPSTKSKFSSLNNLASRLWDSKPKENSLTTSASLSDLDKFDVDQGIPYLRKNTSSTSVTSDDFDAYDAVKKEAASLDESVEDEFSRDNTPPISSEELQKLVKKLEYELDVANGTIKHVYEESTKKLHEVSMQYESKISHIDKKFIECIKEKDIIKSSLDECMDARRKLQSNKENLIKSLSNQADENERLRAKLHMSTDDCVKLKKELDSRAFELSEVKKVMKKYQDDLSSASMKVQWANSKLKSECDAHQSTRTKLAGMDAKVREAKEEANMIRANCQAMIDKYQNSEEIQSNALSSKLEKLEAEHTDLQNQFEMMKSKYENKCVDLEDTSRQLEQVKDQLFEKEADYRRVLQESKTQENDKNKLANQLEDLDEQLNSYNELKAELKNAYHNNQMLDTELIGMKERVETVEKCNQELSDKEKENLDYFQKISGRNADLQLEVNSLKMECEGNSKIITDLTSERDTLQQKFNEISSKYSSQVGESTSNISDLEARIAELEQSKSQLETKVHDLKNESVVAKRKHQADNKDLIRQIEQFRKQFERQEESMRRTESVNSLESGGADRPDRSGTSSEAGDSTSVSNDSGATMSLDNARILLIERLCSLQKVLAKRQEKIEFYESHVGTLTKDVSKKSKIIQSLLLRVETGERTKLASEAYKRSAPSTSIADSFWGSSSNGMTLKLSTEINEKLQQVLEDTLFKNITLKENIKTLGEEIDRLNSRK